MRLNIRSRPISEIKDFFVKANIELLSDVCEKSATCYPVKCLTCFHIWKTTYNRIQQGGKCPRCIGNIRYTVEEIKNLFSLQNLIFLGNIYKNAHIPYPAECCTCGHKWNINFNNVQQGQGCPICKNKKQHEGLRLTHNEVLKSYEDHNLVLLDNKFEYARTNHLTQCKICQYSWKVRLNNIRTGRAGCPKCAGKAKYSLSEVKQLYLRNNLEYLDDIYINVKTYVNTRCLTCRLEYKTRVANVKSGYGCPVCSKFKNEKLMLGYLSQLLGIQISSLRIDCENKNIQDHLIIDAYMSINEQILYIEYNGIQHFEPIDFGQGLEQAKKDFARQTKRDEWLRKYCKDNNIILVEIDGREYTGYKIKPYLVQELTRHGISFYINSFSHTQLSSLAD